MAKKPTTTPATGLASQKKTVVEMTEANLRKKLEEARLKRKEECTLKVNAALKEFNCSLGTDVHVVLNNNHVVQPIIVVL